MIEYGIKAVFALVLLSVAAWGQLKDFPKPPESVYITSWRCLGSVLPRQTYEFRLGKDLDTFSTELIADNGRKFRLAIDHNFYKLRLDDWRFDLVDQTAPKAKQYNLLSEGAAANDYFGVIYPRLKPHVVDGNYQPLWGDGYSFPYVKTVRHIRVDDFVVTIDVTDIKWKNHEGSKVSEVDVTLTIEPWRDRADKDKFPTRDCAGESYQK